MSDASTFDAWRGHTLIDSEGAKVGKIDDIYANDQTGKPEWLTVNTGLFGARSSFVPIRGSHPRGDDLQVPYSKAQIKEAASVEPDGHISAEEVASLYRHYSLELDESTRDPVPPGPPGSEPGMAGDAAGGAAGGAAGRPTGDAALAGRDVGAEDEVAETRGRPSDDAARLEAERMERMRAAEGREARDGQEFMTRSEEEIRVDKEEVESGRVRLHKYVVTEPFETRVPLRREEVRVVREPITDAEAGTGADLAESDTELILHEERPVISKETVPKERVRLEKESVVEERVISDQLRKERIDAEGLDEGRRPQA